MRGEETQLIGALAGDSPAAAARMLLFPGTHSKHVQVAGDRAVGFHTYMTGEFFNLLARQSVLADSVSPDGAWDEGENRTGFEEGVREGARTNLLHACFGVRVSGLFGRRSKSKSYHYLSGLLLGCELRELAAAAPGHLTIVADPVPAARYQHALRVLGVDRPMAVKGVEDSLVRGQARIGANLGWWR
jgi:2-dehydro-3-deoxygalactonokinase